MFLFVATGDDLLTAGLRCLPWAVWKKEKKYHLARERHTDGCSNTQLQAIYFRCHKVWFKVSVFLLNEDHADCLDTWNPVVLRLQLRREKHTLLSRNKQSFIHIEGHTCFNRQSHKNINGMPEPYKAAAELLTRLVYRARIGPTVSTTASEISLKAGEKMSSSSGP